MEFFLRVDYADISLLGGREENQDRVAVVASDQAALLLVVDGMGGHANGAKAAEVTQQVVMEAFAQTPQPLFDPLGFLHLTLGRAHEDVVKLGDSAFLALGLSAVLRSLDTGCRSGRIKWGQRSGLLVGPIRHHAGDDGAR